MNCAVHLKRVDAAKKPDGFWVRVCDEDSLVLERGFAESEMASAGKWVGEQLRGLKDGTLLGVYCYSGKSGELIGIQMMMFGPRKPAADPRAAAAHKN